MDVYHITVDENLNCSYEYESSEPIGCIGFWERTKAVRFNGKELSGQNAYKMYYNLIRLYGESKPCEEPSAAYPVMEVEAAISWDLPPDTDVMQYFIKDDSTYYYCLKRYEYDENGIAKRNEKGEAIEFPVWYEFNKDPECKNSLLDVWEMSQ